MRYLPRQRRVGAGCGTSLWRSAGTPTALRARARGPVLRQAQTVLRTVCVRAQCSVSRPVAELAAFASLSALKHPRRIGLRSALRARPGALRAIALASAMALARRKTVLRTVLRPGSASPPQRRATACPTHLCGTGVCSPDTTHASERRAVPGRGDFWGGEERSLEVGVRSTLRKLTRRGCLSAESEANAASSATGREPEHRNEVGVPADRHSEVPQPAPTRLCRAEAEATHRTQVFN